MQTTPFTCAVVSQEMILHQFGINVSEAQLVYDATVHGWLTDSGTQPLDVGNLLEFYGVPTHAQYGANVESLAAELAQGHKVIVAVNSGELWGSHWPFASWLQSGGADHALVVTGLDLSDPAHPHVVVNDPGDPQGAGKPYPLDQFLHAWSGSGRFFVATDHPPPNLAADPLLGKNFDTDSGMYMDTPFWVNMISIAVGACAEALVRHLLEDALPNEGPGPSASHVLEHFNDVQRNQLFALI
jgi:hypothetical protein